MKKVIKTGIVVAAMAALTGCGAVGAGLRDSTCAMDPNCVKTDLCDNLDGLTLAEVQTKFGTEGDGGVSGERVDESAIMINGERRKKIAGKGTTIHSFNKNFEGNLIFISKLVFRDGTVSNVKECKMVRVYNELYAPKTPVYKQKKTE